jgi:hypothetical protein
MHYFGNLDMHLSKLGIINRVEAEGADYMTDYTLSHIRGLHD